MEIKWKTENRGEKATDCQSSDKSCACGNVKTVIADKIHKVAAAMGERAASQDAQSAMAQYGKQAAEVLEGSAEYIEQLDYEQAEAKVREYIRQNPGLSLLMAGGTGLIIGALFRSR